MGEKIQKPHTLTQICQCLMVMFLFSATYSSAQIQTITSSLTVSDFKEKPTIKWIFKTKSPIFSSPVLSENLVYFGGFDSTLYAIDQEKGFCHWNKSFSKGWGLNNNFKDSILYIGTADERVLIAAEPETGKEFWKRNIEFLVFGNNAYSESMLYLGTTIGKLYGISLNSGEQIWSFAEILILIFGYLKFDTGFTYFIKDNIQIDISYGLGLNKEMNYLSFGFSWNLNREHIVKRYKHEGGIFT